MKMEGWCTEVGRRGAGLVEGRCGAPAVERGPRVEENGGSVAWEHVSLQTDVGVGDVEEDDESFF